MVVVNRSIAFTDSSVEGSCVDTDPMKDQIAMLGGLVSDTSTATSGFTEMFKRAFDLVFASVAIFLLSPVLFLAGLMIKLESRGPAFYSQERIGINRRRRERRNSARNGIEDKRQPGDRRKNIHAGKPFKIYKLRTMKQDAESNVPMLAQKNDPRITRVGNFMRKTRIDEIPQFINVIKGDMSIIGPRPERSFFINQIKQEVPEFTLRLRVKPGITGLAQVEDGYTQTLDMMKKKLFYDLKYIAQFSILHEFRILFKTVMVVFTGKGAC